ncbi:ras-related protein Rab-31-like isoform X3 [Dermacentor silvarum]|uniref:ras-related protein Rab-31-like isoform X3 n=1 Tax=Dermacentor silvarum TaxID=543639 RepID=UPI0021012599|nr:ras-related protein Rab-31-like isoform X3 [Dermacentor silvarum]
MNTTTEVKVCLLGDSGVGKSSILQRFVYNTFNSSAESTIGASFMMKNLVLHDRTFKFNIWDTAGQERESFNAVQSWVRELQLHGDPNIALGIAGNKCDLEDHREVSLATGESYAHQHGAVFVETSALKATNIQELFMGIAMKVPVAQGVRQPELKLSLRKNASKKCC